MAILPWRYVTVKVIQTVINTVLVAAVIVLCAVFLLPRAFGYQPYMVVSASMQQSFPVGSLIYVTDASPEDINVGDPITFSSGSLTITHRVIAIDREQRFFTTEGDNNNTSERIAFDQLLGKALDFSIPYMGYFAAWFITSQGRILTFIILACLLLLGIIIGKMAELEDEDEGEVENEPESVNDAKITGEKGDLTPRDAADIINDELKKKEGEINEQKTYEPPESEPSDGAH